MEEAQMVDMLVQGQQDLSWFGSHIEELKSKYNDQFVAFRNQAVLDADPDFKRLLARLRKRNIDTSSVLVQFVSKVKIIL